MVSKFPTDRVVPLTNGGLTTYGTGDDPPSRQGFVSIAHGFHCKVQAMSACYYDCVAPASDSGPSPDCMVTRGAGIFLGAYHEIELASL